MGSSFLKKGEYTIKRSTIPKAGRGAFTNIYLRKGRTLGEYKGKRLSEKQYNSMKGDGSYVWEINDPSVPGGVVYIDAKPVKKNNWLRYVNDSKDRRVNVESYQYKKRMYYRTIKNVKPGAELFISYGDEYW